MILWFQCDINKITKGDSYESSATLEEHSELLWFSGVLFLPLFVVQEWPAAAGAAIDASQKGLRASFPCSPASWAWGRAASSSAPSPGCLQRLGGLVHTSGLWGWMQNERSHLIFLLYGALALSIWNSFRISDVHVRRRVACGRTGGFGAIHSPNNIWLLLVGFLQVYRNESAGPGYQQ